MLKVKTKLGPSSIHGIGLFADQYIPKDTLIFEEDLFTFVISAELYDTLSNEAKSFLDSYGYYKNGIWKCSIDNDRFMNHSENPNTYESDTCTFAKVDIQEGEEITCDYKVICDTVKYKNKIYGI